MIEIFKTERIVLTSGVAIGINLNNVAEVFLTVLGGGGGVVHAPGLDHMGQYGCSELDVSGSW